MREITYITHHCKKLFEDLLFYLISSLKQQNITVLYTLHTVRTAYEIFLCFKLRREICIQACQELALAHWMRSPIKKVVWSSERSGAAAFITADSSLPPESRDCFGENLSRRIIPASRSRRHHFQSPLCSLLLDHNMFLFLFTSQHFLCSFVDDLKRRFWFVIDIRWIAFAKRFTQPRYWSGACSWCISSLSAALNQRCKLRQKMLKCLK